MTIVIAGTMSLSAQDATAASTYNEGLANLKAKAYPEGLAQMEKALELATAEENEQIIGLAKKNGAVAAYNVGNAALKSSDYDAAMAAYEKGMTLNPEYSSNVEGVARVMEKKGDMLASVTSYLKAADMAKTAGKEKKVKSRLKRAKYLIGKTYVGKKYDDAIKMAESYIAADDANPEVHYYMARAKQATESIEDAAMHIAKAVELSGESVESKYYFYQGEILEAKGDKAGAAAAYKKVTEEKYKAQAEYRAGQLGG